jgi:hypothetical protein
MLSSEKCQPHKIFLIPYLMAPPQNTAISISLQNAMLNFYMCDFSHIDNSDKNEKKCCGLYT